MATPARACARSPFEQAHPGPNSPDELEAGHKYRKRRRRGASFGASELQLGLRGAGCTAAGVLLALLVVWGVGKAHDMLVAPRVQQLVRQERQKGLEAAELQRRGMLLERHSGSGSADGAAFWAEQEPTLGGQAGAGSGVAAAMPPSGAGGTNCTRVQLAEADRQLLRREIGGILRSLSDAHPWVLGLPDAQPVEGSAAQQPASPILTKGQQLAVPGVVVQRVVDERYGRQSSSNIPGARRGDGSREGADEQAVTVPPPNQRTVSAGTKPEPARRPICCCLQAWRTCTPSCGRTGRRWWRQWFWRRGRRPHASTARGPPTWACCLPTTRRAQAPSLSASTSSTSCTRRQAWWWRWW